MSMFCTISSPAVAR